MLGVVTLTVNLIPFNQAGFLALMSNQASSCFTCPKKVMNGTAHPLDILFSNQKVSGLLILIH